VSNFYVPLEITLVRLFGADEMTSQVIKEAVQKEFPKAQLGVHQSIEEVNHPAEKNGRELFVLAGNAVKDAAKISALTDAEGLPCCPVVVLGGENCNQFETVTSGPLDVRLVTQAFRSAVARYSLLRENARLKGDLLTLSGRISHDLKSPLNGILATSEALKEVLQDKAPSSVVLTESLFNSVDEVVKLMNRTSFMLKATALPLPRQKFSMGDVVWTVRQRMESRIVAKKVKILQPESWPEIQGVEPWLEVVWGNLIGNVLEHGGNVTEAELGWVKQENTYHFFVRDNGRGVNAVRLNKLFTPFHSLNAPGNGYGLGLPIAQRLVELHGGDMDYKPVPEGGSLFTFTLPIH